MTSNNYKLFSIRCYLCAISTPKEASGCVCSAMKHLSMYVRNACCANTHCRAIPKEMQPLFVVHDRSAGQNPSWPVLCYGPICKVDIIESELNPFHRPGKCA